MHSAAHRGKMLRGCVQLGPGVIAPLPLLTLGRALLAGHAQGT